jgi:flagellar FliL protein
VVALVITVVLLAAGAGGYLYVSGRRPEPPPSGPVLVKMGEFVTNLAGPDSRRYIKIEIDMEAGSEQIAREISSKTSHIRDQVLSILRSKTVADLAGPEGMRHLAGDIVMGANRVLTHGGITAVYFVEFAIQ